MSTSPTFFQPVAPAPSNPSEGVNDHDARLIWDLVSNMRKPADVLASYGITANELRAKANNGLFASAYREAEKLWKSDMNVQQRIRLKAAFLLEDSLMPMFTIIHSVDMPVSAKLEAIEKLMKISTVAAVPKEGAGVGGGEKHSITINIGGAATPITITSETVDGTATAAIG